MRSLSLVALAAGLVLLTACSAGSSGADSTNAVAASAAADGVQQLTLEVGNGMKFEPSSVIVKAGQPVELTLHNSGDTAHDFSLSAGVAQPVKLSAAGGQTASATFTVSSPGTYSFDCSMPGHAMAGMRGTLIAQ
jgi:nitrite reductase (NO-forming)